MVQISFPYPWLFDGLGAAEKSKAEKKFFFDELDKLFQENPHILKNNINAFILESYQGWGAIFYPKEFINALRKYAHENKILLIFDEIQSGFARTGKLFAFEQGSPISLLAAREFQVGYLYPQSLGEKK